MKNNLKKIFSSVNEILLGVLENFIFPFINSTLNNNNINSNTNKNYANVINSIDKFKENVDKYNLHTKNSNRVKKTKRELFITILKSCDLVINVIKNFSK